MRVVVTGAAGFVGRAVMHQLRRSGHEVLALQSPWSSVDLGEHEGLVVRRADLRRRDELVEALAGPIDGVCHLGARTRVRESSGDPIGYYDTNVAGTVALLDVVRARGVPVPFVYASTAAVYGPAQVYPVDEAAPLRPGNPYSASKAAAEGLVRSSADAGFIGAMILRFANAAGAVGAVGDPDASRIIPKAVAVAAGRFPSVTVNGDGSARREYVHVLDLADACCRALERARPARTEVLNVGSGDAASVAEVVDTTRQVTGQPVPCVHGPPAAEPPLVFADNRRALKALDWVPARSTLARMVADAWVAERNR